MITGLEGDLNLEKAIMFNSCMCAVTYASERRESCVYSTEGYGCFFHIWHPRSDVFIVSSRMDTRDDEMDRDDFTLCHDQKELGDFMFNSCAWPGSETQND